MMRRKPLVLGLFILSGLLSGLVGLVPGDISLAQAGPTVIQAVNPAPPTCVLRNSPDLSARLLQLTGQNFSTTAHNLQFRKVSTGDVSIHFHGEVNWESSTRLSVDLSQIKNLLWSDFNVLLSARLTSAVDLSPVSDWSPQFILADDALACQLAASTNPPPNRTLKVYILNFDPLFSGQPASAHFNWNNPDTLTGSFVTEVGLDSGGIINYSISRQSNINTYPTKPGGYVFSNNDYLACVNSGGQAAHCADLIDYQATLNTVYDPAYKSPCQALSDGEADEIWLWGGPWFGYLEYYLSPLSGTPCPGLTKQAAIMGFSYERGLGSMLHDLSHRAEASLQSGLGLELWDKFDGNRLRYGWGDPSFPDIDPQNTHCGNTHYPPNTNKSYDYDQPRTVMSDCDDWRNWPQLTGQKTAINNQTWGKLNDDPEAGFFRWWFGHFPRNAGRANGIYANWWYYLYPLPQPAISSLSPSQTASGGSNFTLTVDGKDFVTTSTVVWQGQPRPTTYVSRNQLTAAISSADLASGGNVSVVVFNSAPGGGFSNALNFAITGAPPAPTGLFVAAGGRDWVSLGWQDNTLEPTTFHLERRQEGSSNWQEVASVGLRPRPVLNAGLTYGLTYYYRVRAGDAPLYSAYSNEVGVTPADFVVTVAQDNGGAESFSGKLSNATREATSGQLITFALPYNANNLLTIQGPLDPVRGGVTLKGGCSSAGPTVTLDVSGLVNGLVLNSGGGGSLKGVSLNGLKIINASGKPLTLNGTGHLLKCLVVQK